MYCCRSSRSCSTVHKCMVLRKKTYSRVLVSGSALENAYVVMDDCRRTEALRSESKKPVLVHVCNADSHAQASLNASCNGGFSSSITLTQVLGL